ncbi:DUF6236 family protein [Acinetobacter nectaris]|uniref:DUF6236 family protein n=1 Tax=Acinetobacter nectaris TaxID=1219382 RepID=UPI001F266A7A|nr:DUF6236 family protein [Acinetobacter nectaris]MCF9034179.1 hypothetical protein [Acinetobacter nectaris]
MTNTKPHDELSSIKRGIIATPAKIQLNGRNSITIKRGLSEEEILYLVLYWDEIIIPTGSMHISVPFEKDLIQNKILQRPHSGLIKPLDSYINKDTGRVEMVSHEHYAFGEFAKQKIRAEGEDWVIQHYSDDPIYLPEHSNEQNNIRLRVSNILPLPSMDGTVSLHDLIEFKNRRRDELEALHSTMDEVLKKIYSESIHAIKEAELKRFTHAVKELDKTLIERFVIIKKSDWQVSLSPNIPTLLEKTAGIAGAIIADNHLHTQFPIMTAATALTSMLSISKKYGFTFNQFARDDLKLEYIAGAISENIIV